METKTYNGWTNYETWLVNLWLGNEQGTADYWLERARELSGHVYPTRALADELREEIAEQSFPEVPGLYGDLLGAALSEVDWREIAEHWIADCQD